MGKIANAIQREVENLGAIISQMEQAQSAPALTLAGKWLRFMFRIESPAEMGSFGRILATLTVDRVAVYIEPWPENDYAIYVKDEVENRRQVMLLAKQADLIPISAIEV